MTTSLALLNGTDKLRAGIAAALAGEPLSKGQRTAYSAAAQLPSELVEEYIRLAEQAKANKVKGAKAPNVKSLLSFAKEKLTTSFGRLVQLLPTPEQERLLWLNVDAYRWAYNQLYEDYKYRVLIPWRQAVWRAKATWWKRSFYHGEKTELVLPKFSGWEADYALISKKSGKQPEWMKEGVISYSLNSCVRCLNEAKDCPSGFRSKHKALPQFVILQGDHIKFDSGAITLPLIGAIRHTRPDYIPTNAKVCAIGISFKNGKWYAGVSLSIDEPPPSLREEGKTFGIDVGGRRIATGWDGEKLSIYGANPHAARIVRLEKDKVRWQRRMSRRFKKGAQEQSKRYLFAKAQVARIREEIANVRKDNAHQVSHRLLRNDIKEVVVEDLNAKGLLTKSKTPGKKSHGKGSRKANAEAAMGRLLGFIAYKCKWRGIKLTKADQFFPSSKLCSACGTKNKDLGGQEHWTCQVCSAQHQRDENAAKNLHAYQPKTGNTDLTEQQLQQTLDGDIGREGQTHPRMQTLAIAAVACQGAQAPGVGMSDPIRHQSISEGDTSTDATRKPTLNEIKDLAPDTPRQKRSARKPAPKFPKSLGNDGAGSKR